GCVCAISAKCWARRKRRPRTACSAPHKRCARSWEILYDLRFGLETDSALLLRRVGTRRRGAAGAAPGPVRGLFAGARPAARAGGGAGPAAGGPASQPGRELPGRPDGGDSGRRATGGTAGQGSLDIVPGSDGSDFFGSSPPAT